MRFPFLTLVGCLACVLPAEAHNNYFLPGDAFFSVAVERSDILQWTAATGDTLEVSYARFDGEFVACGNIGYSRLCLTGVTPAFRSAMAEAYWRFAQGVRPEYREEGNDGKSVLQESNCVVALIYGRDFSLDYPLGLKFNEDWVAQGAGRYGGFFTESGPVMKDWKYAAAVPPLPVVEKPGPSAHLAANYEVARTIDDALHIKAGDITVFLVGFVKQSEYGSVIQRCPDLQEIHNSVDGARYMAITKDLIRDFECDEKGSWTETPLKLPIPPESSAIPEKPTVPADMAMKPWKPGN
ncbi:MAG: hypothetical protein JWL81_3318 [Verrucomicrobiales bacterium]|nr:hypothetical protein [Verrucomicrobiales bacterium]